MIDEQKYSKRVNHMADLISEIFGDAMSNQISPSDVEEEVVDLFEEEQATHEEKKQIFDVLYGIETLKELEGPDAITISELWVMMKLCDIPTFTLTKP